MLKTIANISDLPSANVTIYPATQILYRKVGYEQGGSFCTWEMPLDSIRISDRTLPIQPVIPLEHIDLIIAVSLNLINPQHLRNWES